jgi:hypothetical protein
LGVAQARTSLERGPRGKAGHAPPVVLRSSPRVRCGVEPLSREAGRETVREQ